MVWSIKLVICLVSTLAVSSYGGSWRPEQRIISGKPAISGQLPHQVILKNDPKDEVLCGGAIIDKLWVLTAAHCTDGLNSVFLVFGTVNLYDYTVSMTSYDLYVHPDYNRDNLNNDVSLIRLPNPVVFSPTIQPIQLPARGSPSYVGAQAIIAGFGYTSDEDLEFSTVLLAANVQVIDNAKCQAVFGNDYIRESTLCANGANGSDQSICTGDSGGPLVIQSAGGYTQIGINSFVAEYECTEGYPSGYVRVTSYLDYIKKITGLNC